MAAASYWFTLQPRLVSATRREANGDVESLGSDDGLEDMRNAYPACGAVSDNGPSIHPPPNTRAPS